MAYHKQPATHCNKAERACFKALKHLEILSKDNPQLNSNQYWRRARACLIHVIHQDLGRLRDEAYTRVYEWQQANGDIVTMNPWHEEWQPEDED